MNSNTVNVVVEYVVIPVVVYITVNKVADKLVARKQRSIAKNTWKS